MCNMQIFSVEKKIYQSLTSHSGTLTIINLLGRDDSTQILVIHEKNPEPQEGLKLFVMKVGQDLSKGAGSHLTLTSVQLVHM